MVRAKLTTEDGISIEVEAESDDYADALAETLRAVRASSQAMLPSSDDGGPPPSQLAELVARLSEETVEYLALLVHRPDGLDDDEIMALLGLDDRQKLAGMNSAITRVADNVNIDGEVIKRKVTRKAEGGRSYHYTVPGPVRAQLAQLLDAPPERSAKGEAPPPPALDEEVPF